MDHPRPCGLVALATLVMPLFAAASAIAEDPPASGVGDAAITSRIVPPATAAAVEPPNAGTPIAVEETEPLDSTAFAARIAARLAAADAGGPSSERTAARTAAPAAQSIRPEIADPEPTADEAGILPAPRPSGSRFIDRFERADGTVGVGDGEVASVAAIDEWWSLPEVRVGGLLAVFVGVAVLARRWSNTRGPRAGRPSGVLSVLARYPFGRGASLVLLEVGPRMVLVHQQGGRGGEVRPIAEFTTAEEIAELRARLGIARREAEPGFGRDLERHLGLYDRKGRPQGFGGPDGLPLEDVMETVDLTRRRPRRGNRTN